MPWYAVVYRGMPWYTVVCRPWYTDRCLVWKIGCMLHTRYIPTLFDDAFNTYVLQIAEGRDSEGHRRLSDSRQRRSPLIDGKG